ncbi:MAG: hypothetical protein IIC02_01920 [Planctomycetes bacterium]|nr:hypothetical protein [Planctomycetota bacterium]
MMLEASRTAIWKSWLGAAVVYLVFFGMMEPSLFRPDTVFGARNNNQIAEAQAWWNGQLDLPVKTWDTATVGTRHYSHFPPLFTFIAAMAVPIFDGVPHWLILTVVVLPIPALAFFLFKRVIGRSGPASLLAIGLICGTSLWPVIDRTVRGAYPYPVNHALATIGVLILLGEVFGKRRIWVAGAGLVMATMARQLTVFYAIPLLIIARSNEAAGSARSRTLALVVTGVFVFGVPAVLNSLKFGSPFDTGYMRIYEGRTDALAEAAHAHGLFSPYFVPANLYHMNLGLPRFHRIERAGVPEYHLRPNFICTGIWWTTPLLIWLFWDIRRILSDPARRGVLMACAMVFVCLLFFHGAGQDQRGFNRFSLDFLPGVMALVAPCCFEARRKWISGAMVAWSLLYFRWLI